MNAKNKKIIWWGIGSVSVLTIATYLIHKKVTGSTAFKRRLKKNALQEYEKWNEGKTKESDPKMLPTLQTYWKQGAGVGYTGKSAQDEAWSAAYISYLMKKSGAGNDFPYAPSHSVYITESIKNRKQNNSSPFKGYKPTEKALQVGDLVCVPRQPGIGYDTASAGYLSHCDLVINVDKKNGIAKSIGGNVSNSVSVTNVPITNDGKINFSKTSKDYFVVIKNNK